MLSYTYTNKENKKDNIDTLFKEGEILHARQYYTDSTVTERRIKMIVLPSFEGTLSIHMCFSCSFFNHLPSSIASIAHFRKTVWESNVIFAPNLTRYFSLHKKTIQWISS